RDFHVTGVQTCALPICARHSLWQARRAFLQLGGSAMAAAAVPAWAQVQVGEASRLRHLVPAEDLEQAANQQYAQLIQQAQAKGEIGRASCRERVAKYGH